MENRKALKCQSCAAAKCTPLAAICLALVLLLTPVALPIRSAGAAEAGKVNVAIETSLGQIVLELDRDRAPKTVENFLTYAKEGHYDSTIFYRVVPGFMIQAGSYDTEFKPRGVHDPIALEADNGLSNLRGAIAMARGEEPSSARAEFFINLVNNTGIDHMQGDTENKTGYAVFGHVIAGMDIIDKIAMEPTGGGGPFPGFAPLTPVVIAKIVPIDGQISP